MSQKNKRIDDLLKFERDCLDFTSEDMYVTALFWDGKGRKRIQKNLDSIMTKESVIEKLNNEKDQNWTVEMASLINEIAHSNSEYFYYEIRDTGEINGRLILVGLEQKERMYIALTKGKIEVEI